MIERKSFVNVIEVVPPAGPDAETVLSGLETLKKLPVHVFSVASNPVAKPRMSALAMCDMIQSRIGFPAILHCTTRDHNRLSLQGLLWGAKALGIETIMATTGDFIALKDRTAVSSVRDIDVYDLIGMAKKAGLSVGVVFDQISGNVGVMHEGRMIFVGTMREMKHRLRRDHFSLDLEGSEQDVKRLAQQAGELEGVEAARVDSPQTLVVRLVEGRSRAGALAEVLGLVESAGLSLHAVHSGQNETENAYLQLLQEDVAHGFQRFDLDARGPTDAPVGDPSP